MSDQPPPIKITHMRRPRSASAGSALEAIRDAMDCPKNADRWVIVQWVRDLKEDQAARELQNRKDQNRIRELEKQVERTKLVAKALLCKMKRDGIDLNRLWIVEGCVVVGKRRRRKDAQPSSPA